MEMSLIKVVFEITESFRTLENIKPEAKAKKRGKTECFVINAQNTCVPGWAPAAKMEIAETMKLTERAKSVI